MAGSAALICMKEGKEHMVVSCQQEMSASKVAIQQYNIPVQWIFQTPTAIPVSFEGEKTNTPVSNNTNASGSGLLSMLGMGSNNNMNGPSSSSSEKIEGDVTGTSSALMNMVYGGSKVFIFVFFSYLLLTRLITLCTSWYSL